MVARRIEAIAVIKARDETRGVFAAIAARAKAMGRALSGTEARVGGAGGMLSARSRARADSVAMRGYTGALAAGRAGGGIGAGLPVGALAARAAGVLGPAALAYGGARSLTNYADAERAMTRIGITAGATREELVGALDDTKKLAFSTAQPFERIVEGMDAMAAQGRSMKEVMATIPSVAKTAQAAGAEVVDIAKTADAIQSHLGVQPEKMQTAFDIAAESGKRGSFELKDSARYLPSLLPAAKALGIKGTSGLSDIMSLMQMVRKSSGTSEEAAASMSDIMQKLEIEETTKKFKKFGVDSTAAFAKARKEGRNVFDVLEEIVQTATKGDLSKLPQLFGDKEALRFVRSLMQDGGRWRRESADIQKTAPGTIDRDISPIIANTRARIDQMSIAFDNAAKSLGALIAIPATPFLKELAEQSEKLRKALEGGAITKAIDEASDRWEAKKAKKLRDDADGRSGAIDAEIAERQRSIDEMDAQDRQPVTGRLNRDTRARRRERERAIIEGLKAEKATLRAQLDGMSDVNTRIGVNEQQRRAAGASAFVRGPGTLPGDIGTNPARFGFGVGGALIGVPQFGDGLGGRAVPHPLPPARPANLGQVTSSSDDLRSSLNTKVEAVVTAPVTATLNGSATVDGSTKVEVTVRVDPSGITSAIANAVAPLKGLLNAQNGRGSTGRSSPDAGSASIGEY